MRGMVPKMFDESQAGEFRTCEARDGAPPL